MLENPSRLGNVLLEFLIANPHVIDPLTAYNVWARQDKQKYGTHKTQRAILAMRYLNVLLKHSHDELKAFMAVEEKYNSHVLFE